MYCEKITRTSKGALKIPAASANRIFFYSGWKKPNLPVIGFLRESGYCVEQIVGWREAEKNLPKKEADLLILDFDMAAPESLTALIKIREAFKGPLIVLSERPDEIFHILALDLGADDFMGGEVSRTLLVARIKALLRMAGSGRNGAASAVSLGTLVIDAGRREVSLDGHYISFTSVEFDLLHYLGRNAGSVVSREDLYRDILNKEYNGINRTVDMYISRLRKKLGDDNGVPRMLKTVRGTGYLMSRQVP